jgi:hypothetical protein
VEELLALLGVDLSLLEELRREGLFEEDWVEPETADELRIAASLVRDLGVNPAGVDVVLHLRRRLMALEERMSESLRRLLAELEKG